MGRRWRRIAAGGAVVGMLSVLLAVLRPWHSPHRAFERALDAWRAGQTDAVQCELRALEEFPTFAPHRRFLSGALLVRAGRFDEALLDLELCLNHPELQVDSLILSGQAFYQTGRAGNAQQLWNRALELNPQHVDLHRWLGVLYYDLGAMDLALTHLRKVSELAPTDARPDRLMGLINKDYERPELAVQHYRESLRRNPSQPDREKILMELARCQLKLFDYGSAREVLLGLSGSAEQQALLAECSLSTGDPESARSLVLSALRTDPRNKDALLLHGRMELENGRFEEAVRSLTQATQYYPKDFVIRFKLVQALRRSGDGESAREQERIANELQQLWRRFSDLHMQALKAPRDAVARQELGSLALQLDRPDLARTWWQAALAIEPRNQQIVEQLRSLP